ncbi:MAG: hypothetical protein K6T66_14405 [Peptococcaceae bacterium]|nr:hypothetical protein [Peptococcaceae bacterium]
MNFKQMKTRGWQVIDDSPNNPIEIDDALMGEYINEAVQDLAESLGVVKSANLSFSNGAAWLPDDCLEAIQAFDGTAELKRIHSIRERTAADDADTAAGEYFIPNDGTIRIYGRKLSGAFTLYYKPFPDQLVNDNDTPELIPARYRHFIPEIYVKAQHALKNGRVNTYRVFMSLWEDIRREIAASQQAASFEQEETW